ncbi:MAG: 16S rRNA (adenine(1518)-N(6)/adenine(1519)-N(6))-dimethyltransferase RsmA [Christensenellaceae bacterium]|jgi:16S rRNA (adenine1518-N6/adenine1519-N6)-dimethyltransferase|nr:16S rRNA (adenine(1518)-N(6)/adenine(1519)-N(6))-dimethyltransferase RsmA [Christensenellaceae bacterium]
MTDAHVIQQILQRFGLTPNRALGQNFLADPDAAAQIAEAACAGGLPVLEIGPGLGALTGALLKGAPRVCAVEIDAAMIAALGALFEGEPNLRLYHADFLKADLNQIYREALRGPFAVAANLPYYATTPICMRLLTSALPALRMALMLQTEAAARFFARPREKVYGPLAVLAQYGYEVAELLRLSPGSYYPQPSVDSTVVLLTKNDREPLSNLPALLHMAFAMRRKTLANNLKALPGAPGAMARCGISPQARAEELTPEEFAALAKELDLPTP